MPVLERASGLAAGPDFTVGYSPERINPGDKTHRFENITKVVAGQDAKTLEIVAAGLWLGGDGRHSSCALDQSRRSREGDREYPARYQHRADERAFGHLPLLGIDTGDVLAAARTKWNFLPFHPGLVGGHCIGVDPYYLTHRAERAGLHPEVILAGRRINDGVGRRVARECVRLLLRAGASDATVTVLGLTFKEDVPDIRNSKVADIVGELQLFGLSVQIHDPIADAATAMRAYGLSLLKELELEPADAVVLAVSHDSYRAAGWPLISRLLKNGRGLVMDVKGALDLRQRPPDVEVWRL